jgi:hypothetical protein
MLILLTTIHYPTPMLSSYAYKLSPDPVKVIHYSTKLDVESQRQLMRWFENPNEPPPSYPWMKIHSWFNGNIEYTMSSFNDGLAATLCK